MSKQAKVLETMTFQQLLDELRALGLCISAGKLSAWISQGLLPFAQAIHMTQTEYIIWRRGFEEWVDEHCVVKEII